MPKNKICSGCHYPYRLLEPYMGAMCSTEGKCGSINTSQRGAEIRARIDELDTFRIVTTIYITEGGDMQNIKNEIKNRIAELEAQLKDTTKGENDE